MRQSSFADAAALLGGFLIWSIAFATLYGAHGLLCSVDLPEGLDCRAVLVVLVLAAIGAHLCFAWWVGTRPHVRRDAADGRDGIARALALAALLATIWSSLPVLIFEPC